ncbi:Fork head domain transcription factor slp1 [Trametes pubescens]|uniref:Fork head domain transcription factor slp1 n=1 Tax=Trametes pubescens TaxID=154538 RepID=A0A1M2V777_TRAPU|nr:Fork head domain transcription factor slp1 [Trametes pubescens]
MANDASSGRFYPFTTDPSASLSPSAASPDPQYCPETSGSDSVSDDDRGAIGHSYPVERTVQGQDIFREPFGAQDVSGFPQDRLDPAPATIYLDDTSYLSTGLFRSHPASNFLQTAPNVPFAPVYGNFNPAMPPSMTSTTPHDTPLSGDSGDSSPADSNGSGGTNGSGHLSGSSLESASSGAASYYTHGRASVYQDDSVSDNLQRVGQPSSYSQDHYPAYDDNNRRVGMEHARFGTDPRQSEYSYYPLRASTYPPLGAHGMAPGMESPENTQTSNFSSPDLPMMPTHSDDFSYEHDAPNDLVMPGLTQIHLPDAPAPRHQEQPFVPQNRLAIYSGDDAMFEVDDDEIRQLVGLQPHEQISLQALADPPNGRRPGQSIPLLSQLAILGSPQRRLTLQEIYRTLEDRFEWFRLNKHDKSWQNSIRHNLSLYKCFRRVSKPITEPGKGSYWTVDYTAGAGTKRPRKRNKKTGAAGKSQDQTQDDEEGESASQAEQSKAKPSTKPPSSFSSFSKSIPTAERYRPYESIGIPSRNLSSRIESDYRKRHPDAPPLVTRSSYRASGSGYTRASKQSARDRPLMDQGSAGGMRLPDGSYGGPAFGQPAFNPAAFKDHQRGPSTTWPLPGPSQPPTYHPDPLQHRSSSHSFSMDQLPPLQNFPRPRAQPPSRSNTLPTNIAEALNDPTYARGPLLPPPRDMYDQARNDYDRFAQSRSYHGQPLQQHYSFPSTRSYAGQSTGEYHSFTSPPSRPYHESQTPANAAEHTPPSAQGSSGGGRRESPSESESSHD